jgi:two-component system phosphate regulon sensor histidine kinase PhoR
MEPASKSQRRVPLRQGRTWLGGAAVVASLALLLGLQYRALVRLEEASAAAQRLSLRAYAKAILQDVEDFYRAQARALDVPAELLAPEREAALRERLAARTQGGEGLKRFYAVAFDARGGGALRALAPDGGAAAVAAESAEARAVRFALAPLRLAARERTALESAAPIVDERDPANPVVLKPVLDGAARVLGVVGFVADPEYLRAELLPRMIAAEAADMPAPLRGNVIANVRDPGGPVVAGASESAPLGEELAPRLRFVFTQWRLGLGFRSVTPEQWARFGFWINLSLALLATTALAAAIALALRSAARATRLSRMQTEFVSNVSHELRTPLASLRVFGELLGLGRVVEPEKVREYGRHIESEAARLEQLVDHVLDFARLESAERRYRFERIDPRELVEETLRAFETRLEQEGFSVALAGADAPLPPIQADPEALGQALANLIDNAIKYSGRDRELRVELGSDGRYVTIAVCDRGPGIPEEEHARVFDKFHRVGNALVHDVKGSGLGLAIVKHVAEAHGGGVALDSRPGAGSRFSVRIPADAG